MNTFKMLLALPVLLISNLAIANNRALTPVDCTFNGAEHRIELEKDDYGNAWGELSVEGTEASRTFKVQRFYGTLLPGVAIGAYSEGQDEVNAFVLAHVDIEKGREVGSVSKGDKIVCKF